MTTAPSQVIPALLRLIAGTPPMGDVDVAFHAPRTSVVLDPARVEPGVIPTPILRHLEAHDQIHASLVTRAHGHGVPQQLGVAWVTTQHRSVYVDGLWRRPDPALAASVGTLSRLPAPALILVGSTPRAGAGWCVTALWPLADPITLATDAGRLEAHALLGQLATHFGGQPPPADLRAAVVELPGSRMRELSVHVEYAEALVVGDLTARHSADALRLAFPAQESTR